MTRPFFILLLCLTGCAHTAPTYSTIVIPHQMSVADMYRKEMNYRMWRHQYE